jgi:hypothetical protein
MSSKIFIERSNDMVEYMSNASAGKPNKVAGEGNLYDKKPKFGFEPNASFSVRGGAVSSTFRSTEYKATTFD